MMIAAGSDSALELSLDGKPVVVLNHAKLGFSLGGQAYTVRRSGFFGPLYELQRDGLTLVSAKQAAFTFRYAVSLGDRAWTLKSLDFSEKRFGLFDGATQVGGISPASRIHYTSDITIDLPEALPLAGQVFLMWLLLWKWGARRRPGTLARSPPGASPRDVRFRSVAARGVSSPIYLFGGGGPRSGGGGSCSAWTRRSERPALAYAAGGLASRPATPRPCSGVQQLVQRRPLR